MSRRRLIRETVSVVVELKLAYEDKPGARAAAIEVAKTVPLGVSGASVRYGYYEIARGPTRILEAEKQE